VPNQFVAACWIVNCNIGYGYGFIDANDNGQLDDGEELISPTRQTYYKGRTRISYVSGCGEEHKGVSIGDSGPIANALWCEVSGWRRTTYKVYYWEDSNGGHATKIDSAQWQTNKNAS